MRLFHGAAAILLGIALVAALMGGTRFAIVAILLVQFVQLFSMEALRVLILSIREYRR